MADATYQPGIFRKQGGNTLAIASNGVVEVPAASNGTVFATHTTQTMTHSIRIYDDAGTAYYIMCTNAATNRG